MTVTQIGKSETGRWQDVTEVHDRVGVNGGEFWELELSCGHVVVRRKRIVWSFSIFGRFTVAPKRVRCGLCKSGKA
jgi:hypothetical protein